MTKKKHTTPPCTREAKKAIVMNTTRKGSIADHRHRCRRGPLSRQAD